MINDQLLPAERTSARGYLSIGEFSALVGLSVSALRFYADRSLLLPAEVDPLTSYRRYTTGQREQADIIRRCRLVNMSLEQIRTMLEASPDERSKMAQTHLGGLERTLTEARAIAGTFTADDFVPTVLSAAALRAGLSAALVACSTDAERPDLACIRIELRDHSIRFAATDRHRLSVRDLVPTSTGTPFALTVSSHAMGRWSEVLASETGDVMLSIAVGHLQVRAPNLDASAPLLAVNFPDYEVILNPVNAPQTTALVDKQHLADALDSTISDHSENNLMRVSIDRDAGLQIGHGPDAIVVESTTEGPLAQVTLNSAYMRDALQVALPGEVLLEVRDEASPVGFRGADDGSSVTMIMPVISPDN